MALLAILDVDDVATEKIKGTKNALEDLVATAQRSAAALGNVNAKAAAGFQGSAAAAQAQQAQAAVAAAQSAAKAIEDANLKALESYNRLANAQRAAFTNVTQSLKAGAPVTKQMADAVRSLSEHYGFAAGASSQLTLKSLALTGAFREGQVMTKEHTDRLKEFGNMVGLAANQTEEQAGKMAGFRAQALALAAALGVLSAGLQHYLREAAELAARVETLGVVTQITARNAGYTTAELRTQSEAIKRLGITTVEATDAVLQFVRSNLNLADASKIARAAQDLAVVAGENSSQTYKRLVTAIQTGETMLLRQVGIVTTNEQIWAKYAQTVGKTAATLSTAEKQQAMVNKILDEARTVTGAYEASMNTAGKQMSSMARFVEELQLKFGQALLPTLTLIVTGLYKLLGAMNSITPETARLVAAMGTFVTAMTAVLAVITAAKWLALGAAIQALISPVGLLVAAIAALAAGFVYYRTKAGETIDITLQQISAHDAASASIEKNFEKFEKLTAAGVKLGAAGKATTKDQDDLRKSTDDLAKAVPTAIEAFDKLTNSYQLNRDEIRKVIESNEQLRESYLKVAEAQVGAQEQRVSELEKQRQDLIAAINKTRQDVGLMSIDSPTQLMEGIQEKLKAEYERPPLAEVLGLSKGAVQDAKDTLKSLGDELAQTMKDLNTANVALKNSREIIAEYGGAVEDRIGKIREGVTKGFSDFVRDAKKYGVSIKAAFDEALMKDPGKYRQALSGLVSDVQRAADKATKEQAKYKQAFDAALQQIRSDGTATKASMAAVNQGLGEVAEGTEEYRTRVLRASSAIGQFNKSSVEAQRGLTHLAKAAEFLTRLELEKWATGVSEQFDKMGLAAGEAMNKVSQGLSGEVSQMFRQQFEQELELREAHNEKIFALDQQIADRRAEQTLEGVDLAIYQENRRVQEIARAIEKEIAARERAQRKAEDAFEDRVRQAQAEVRELERNIRLQIDLLEERTAAEIRFQEVAGTISSDMAERRIAALRQMRDEARQELADRAQLRQSEIEEEATIGRRRLQQTRALNAQLAAEQRGALDRQKVAQAEYIQQLRRDNDAIFQLSRGLAMTLADSIAKGFLDILSQARSTKDAFIGIVRSMADTVLSIISDMVTQWIRRAAILATAGGGFNWGTFFRSLASGVGTGGGVGSVANLTGSYAQLGMSGGALTMTGGGAGAGAAGTGGAGAALMGGALAAGGGYGVGTLMASKFGRDSYFHSGGIGAASGAMTGMAIGSIVPGIGTGVGAGIGAIAGAIGGWLQERKRRKEMQKERDAIIEDMGGLDEFKRRAEEAGVALDKFLSTKKTKEYAAELDKIQKAFIALDIKKFIDAQGGMDAIVEKAKQAGIELSDAFKNGTGEAADMQRELEKVAKALQLQEAKNSLAQTVTQMDALRKRAVLVGYDLKKLYDADTIEKFNIEQEKLNKLLEEQNRRLAGLGTAAAGINQRVAGLRQFLDRGWKDVFSTLGEEGQEEFEKAWERAQERGYQGGPLKFLLENMDEFKTSMTEATGLFEKMQGNVDRVGVALSATFGGVLRETGDIMAAFEAVSGSLDELSVILAETGVEASGSLKFLMEFRNTIRNNEDVANSLSGINQILKGLADSGRLTAEVFNTMGADAAEQWRVMMERGVAADQALLLMQPTLQSLYEAQKNFGFATDEATQNLIDMGVANGVVGDQFQSVNSKMLDMLMLIAEALGADIPEAYRRQTEAADAAAQAAQDAARQQEEAAQDAADSLIVIGDRAEDTGELYGDWRDHIQTVRARTDDLNIALERTEWERPGQRGREGLVEMESEFVAAKDVVRDFADYAVEQLERVVETASAISLGHSPGGLKEIPLKTRDAMSAFVALRMRAEHDLGAVEQRVNSLSGAMSPEDPSPRRREPTGNTVSGESTSVTVQMGETKIEISAGSEADGEKLWREKIRPQFQRDLAANTEQMASRVAAAARRYR